MPNPFAKLIELKVEEVRAGHSELGLEVGADHLNPHGVVHGAVVYAMADTGMGAALYPTLEPGQICATIEIKINYFKPISSGRLSCISAVVNRGKTIANLESRVLLGDVLVAQANGNFAIFTPSQRSA